MIKIILLCGGSCSGKTTLSNLLADLLKDTLVISLDNYFLDYSSYSEKELEDINFDIPEAFHIDLLLENITDILKGIPTLLPIYDFSNHKIGQWKEYRGTPKFIIVEGVMSFEIKQMLEISFLKIFIDTPLDIMLWRRVSRDNIERFFDIKSTLKRYIEYVRPSYLQIIYPKRDLADIIIDGSSMFDKDVLFQLSERCSDNS